jgi:oligoribonuclease
MSGLEPEKNRILELAILVTDGDLQVVAEGPELVLHQSDALLAGMDEWNTKHHGESGLVDRVKASTIDETAADERLLGFIAQHVPPHGAPLAGNSIHQDRLFVSRYLPRLSAHLHYRNVDVSTVKELVRRWYPQAYEARPTKKGKHRALDDIRESVEELRYYRKTCFR